MSEGVPRASASERVAALLAGRLDGPGLLKPPIDPRYTDDLNGKRGAVPDLVLRPRDAADVVAILAACNAVGQPVVVQGGRTGLAGGARVCPGEVVLSLERMTAIGPVEPVAGTVIAEAGVPLQALQESADAAGFLFGVDLGSRGTATVGGIVATNAGGVRVLRYGMCRAQVLGVEAVLADGSIVSSLRGLAKDNTGYDLGQFFTGSEGTLGVVTRACFRLHPKPTTRVAAFCAVPSLEAANGLLRLLRARLGHLLAACEILFAPLYDETVAFAGLAPPLATGAPAYVLADIQGFSPGADEEAFAAALAAAHDDGLVRDVVLSQSERDFAALWAIREECSRYLFARGPALGMDISVAPHRLSGFLDAARATAERIDRQARTYLFGHLGDGNLHTIVETAQSEAMADALLKEVARAGGSISAEHGIGLDKKARLHLSRSPAEIAAMRRLKAAFDPNAILNRGRIFDAVPPPA